MEFFVILVIMVLTVVLLSFVFWAGIQIGRRQMSPNSGELQRQLQDLRLAKAADERLIKNLEGRVHELEWQVRRGIS